MEPLIGSAPVAGDLIKDSDTQHFVADVIEASRKQPVIVDFWAPWCGPCKTLGPALEKAVRDARGEVKLVKINVDTNQELAAQMRIQSIPAVYAFKDGRPVDGFVGALPESQIKSFIGRLAGEIGPSPVDQALEQAQAALDGGDAKSAAAIFEEVLRHLPESGPALAGLVRADIALGELDRARTTLNGAGEAAAKHADVAGARAALELAEQAKRRTSDGVALEQLRARLGGDANDHQTRYDLAMVLYAAGEREAAVDQLLDIVRRNRGWNEEAARKQLVKLFEAFGPQDPLTIESRRRLSSILFS